MNKVNRWLLPLSWLYGLGVRLRNRLYDMGWKRSYDFGLPVFCVGNITVGGTGKTPHTEYLIRLFLGRGLRVGVVSRGYGRLTSGYWLMAGGESADCVGDEPAQMKRKYPDIWMAVSENRLLGLGNMMATPAGDAPQVYLLDDAFQHRRVRAGVNIVLADYGRPVDTDALLPAGRLREPVSGLRRADIVVVTKCPPGLTRAEADAMAARVLGGLKRPVFFTTLRYGRLTPYCGGGDGTRALQSLSPATPVLMIAGIAVPARLEEELRRHTSRVSTLTYADHHRFSPGDVDTMARRLDALPPEAIAVTTEKDAARMAHLPLPEAFKGRLYTLPVEAEFLFGEGEAFNSMLLNYAGRLLRDSSLC